MQYECLYIEVILLFIIMYVYALVTESATVYKSYVHSNKVSPALHVTSYCN